MNLRLPDTPLLIVIMIAAGLGAVLTYFFGLNPILVVLLILFLSLLLQLLVSREKLLSIISLLRRKIRENAIRNSTVDKD